MEVWIVLVKHRHGEDVAVCDSESKAYHYLFQYVEWWWKMEEELKHELMPSNRNEAIDKYFELVENEDYEILLRTVR